MITCDESNDRTEKMKSNTMTKGTNKELKEYCLMTFNMREIVIIHVNDAKQWPLWTLWMNEVEFNDERHK